MNRYLQFLMLLMEEPPADGGPGGTGDDNPTPPPDTGDQETEDPPKLGDEDPPPKLGDDDPEPEDGPPDAYELKLPEATSMEARDVEEVEKLARELGLNNEKAQALLESVSEREAQRAEALKEEQVRLLEETAATWAEELQNDPDFGGVNLEENMAKANRAMRKLLSKEEIEELRSTPFASKLWVARVFRDADDMMQNDKIATGPVGRTPREKSLKERMYPEFASKGS